MKKFINFISIFLFSFSVIYAEKSYAGPQIAWTKENCYRVKGVSAGSADYIRGNFGNYTFYYAKPKFFYGANREGCEIYLKTSRGIVYCSSRSLHQSTSDPRRAFSHVDRCAYR